MDYYIFRHGLTYEAKTGSDFTQDSIISTPILPEGIPTIEKLAKYLGDIKTDANFSSPLLRCQQTIEVVEKITKMKFELDERLGEFLGLKGETFDSFATRIKNFVDDIQSKNFEFVAICTHGAGIAGLKHWVLERKFEEYQLYDFPKPGVLWIIKEDKTIESIDFNVF